MLLLANLILAALLTGLIWFVQIVHYPIFRQVPAAAYASYHAMHTRTTGQVVALPMLLELGLAGWMLFQEVPEGLQWLNYLAFGCVVVIWGTTFGISVPLHNRFEASGHDLPAINRLVATNWVRTLAWTARTGLLTYLTVRTVSLSQC